MMTEQWYEFAGGNWQQEVDVRDFILKNYRLYDGDDTFLVGPTEATTKLWDQVMDLTKKERENGGVLDMDTKIVSTITSHDPGYLNKDLEKLSVFKLTYLSNALCNHSVESVWQKLQLNLMALK